jgi:acyl-coenzyme A thioesterase PaaI-like protein
MKRDRESPVRSDAFQDLIPHNHCFGCGPNNPKGLRIKSNWSGNQLSVARFTPEPYHCAGPTHFVNGGILATVIDCHCVCTAAAAAYRDKGREIGSKPYLHYATANLDLRYIRPTPIEAEIELVARIVDRTDRTYVLSCELSAEGRTRVTATLEAIQVRESWVLGDKAATRNRSL